MRIIFFGTPPFAAYVLKHLLSQGIDIAAVVTKPDKPKGRLLTPTPPAVKLLANEYGLTLYQPEKVSDLGFLEILEKHPVDLYVVVAYGEILKEHVLKQPKLACVNLHASLLPLYRGAAPIHRSLMAGDSVTGVSIMHMARQMDSGAVIAQTPVNIDPNMTYSDLEAQLMVVGASALSDVIERFKKGFVAGTEQDHEAATYASKIELEECEVLWNNPCNKLHNLIRAVQPTPGAWCWASYSGEKRRLKIHASRIKNTAGSYAPGSIIDTTPTGVTVGCSKGALELCGLQWEGRKRMGIEEFVRGLNAQALDLAIHH